MLSLLLFSVAVVATPLVPEAVPEAVIEANRLSDKNEIRCEYRQESGALSYIGPTDENLTTCLARTLNKPFRTLTVTSIGGNVDTAIGAAMYIRSRRPVVNIVGQCISSCANYIATSGSSLVIRRYGIVLLHGGPDQAGLDTFIKTGRDSLKTSAPQMPDEAVEQAYAMNVARIKNTLAMHTAYRTAMNIGEQYFSLADFRSQASTRESSKPWFARADAAFIRSCVPGLVVRDENKDARFIDGLYGDVDISLRKDEGRAYACGPR